MNQNLNKGKVSEVKNLTPKVIEQDGKQVVSARELYTYLDIGTDFTDWCKRMFDYGFVEKQDYVILLKFEEKPISKSNPIDYALTLDTAKEISMLQRSEKGKQARQYFIACERRLRENANTVAIPTHAEALRLAADAIERVELQKKQLQLQAPKVEYYEEVLSSSSTYTTTLIAKELGMSAIELNKLLHVYHVQFKQSGTWVLYSDYQSKGYTKTKTFPYTDMFGETHTKMQTEWTESGREFIHSLIKMKQNSA